MSQLFGRSLAFSASLSLAVMAQAGPLSGTNDLSSVGTTTPGARLVGIGPGMSE